MICIELYFIYLCFDVVFVCNRVRSLLPFPSLTMTMPTNPKRILTIILLKKMGNLRLSGFVFYAFKSAKYLHLTPGIGMLVIGSFKRSIAVSLLLLLCWNCGLVGSLRGGDFKEGSTSNYFLKIFV